MSKRIVSFLAAAIAIAVVVGIFAGPAKAVEQKFITLGTGSVTGVYYPAGGAICRLVNRGRKSHGIRCSVESTDGSVYNINAILAGELDMGITQSDVQGAAVSGQRSFIDGGPRTDLRAVFSLHPEPLHLIVRADAGIDTFDDLQGKRVNIGNPGSGQRATTDQIMQAKGWTNATFSLASEMKSSDQSKALCDDKIDAAFFTVGIPNGSIKEATTSCDTKLVPMSGGWVDAFLSKHPIYAKATIPGGMYRGNPDDVQTFGPKGTFVASSSLSADVVYNVVKAVFENFDDFKRLHPAFASLKKEEMVKDGLSAPLHEGAVRYFKEAGLM